MARAKAEERTEAARGGRATGATDEAARSRAQAPAWVKPAIFCVVLLLLAFVSYASGITEGLSSIEQWSALETLVEENLLASIAVYFACTVVGASLLMVPGMVFALSAGALFGPLVGTAVCSVSTTAGAIGAFLAARFFLRDAVRPWVCKNRYVRRWLFEETGTNALVTLMITRLVPLFPYNVQNFAYGITDMRLGTYSLCSFVFMLPATAMYVFIGAGLTDGSDSAWLLLVSVGLAAATFAIAGVLKRRYMGQDAGAADAAAEASASVAPDDSPDPDAQEDADGRTAGR